MLPLSPRNINIKQMLPKKIREAVVMVNSNMVVAVVVVIMGVVVVAIKVDRMVAPGSLSNIPLILVPKRPWLLP
jgi:hypothetical protein